MLLWLRLEQLRVFRLAAIRFKFDKVLRILLASSKSKIDIEGSEADLFRGDVSWLKLVKVMVIELHDHLRPSCSKTLTEALQVFEKLTLEWKGENLIVRNLDHNE